MEVYIGFPLNYNKFSFHKEFSQKIFIEHLLCVRHWASPWVYSAEPKKPLPSWNSHSNEESRQWTKFIMSGSAKLKKNKTELEERERYKGVGSGGVSFRADDIVQRWEQGEGEGHAGSWKRGCHKELSEAVLMSHTAPQTGTFDPVHPSVPLAPPVPTNKTDWQGEGHRLLPWRKQSLPVYPRMEPFSLFFWTPRSSHPPEYWIWQTWGSPLLSTERECKTLYSGF